MQQGAREIIPPEFSHEERDRDDILGSKPFPDVDPREEELQRFLNRKWRKWFRLESELVSIGGPSKYQKWLRKHPVKAPTTGVRCLPGTFNPEGIVDFIDRCHSMMFEVAYRALLAKETESDTATSTAARLVDLLTTHRSMLIENARRVLKVRFSKRPNWRDERLRFIRMDIKRRWPVTSWPANNAPPAFWHQIRQELEQLPKGQYQLRVSSASPFGPLGEPLNREYSWVSYPDEDSRARLRAIVTKAARALGHNSEDGLYDELLRTDFVQCEFTGGAGSLKVDTISNVLPHIITLTHLLVADSELKASHVNPEKQPETVPQCASTAQPESSMAREELASCHSEAKAATGDGTPSGVLPSLDEGRTGVLDQVAPGVASPEVAMATIPGTNNSVPEGESNAPHAMESAKADQPHIEAATVRNEDNKRASRRQLHNDYKAECKQKGVKVNDAMIAKAANKSWNTRDSIQKWLSCDPKYDGTPDRLIRDVFLKKPHLNKQTDATLQD